MTKYDETKDISKAGAEREALARELGLMLWQFEMAQAVDDKLLRDIVRENRVSPHQHLDGGQNMKVANAPVIDRAGTQGQVTNETASRGWGWAEAQPLTTPPGTAWIDAALPAKKGGG
jgi:hypothetical protein